MGCKKPFESNLKVILDVSEVPELEQWGKEAQQLLMEWIPITGKILDVAEFPPVINLIIQKSDKGIAYADSNKIVVSSHWVEKHPEDIGLIVHEGVHVVQMYPDFDPSWLTEGIADYIRWHLYEEKPIEWFPLSENEKGWEDAYRVTGGFLLWLVLDKNPKIVKILNSTMETATYSDEIFKIETGIILMDLWKEYELVKSRHLTNK